MNQIVGPLRQAWDGRTRREQRMLALMAALVFAVAAWLGVVRPLSGWREDAARDRVRAEAELVEVRQILASLPASPQTRPSVDAQGLEPVLRQAAGAAGLEITTGMDASGRLGFSAPHASSQAVFGWLAALKTAHGLEPASLSVVENADATLQVDGAF